MPSKPPHLSAVPGFSFHSSGEEERDNISSNSSNSSNSISNSDVEGGKRNRNLNKIFALLNDAFLTGKEKRCDENGTKVGVFARFFGQTNSHQVKCRSKSSWEWDNIQRGMKRSASLPDVTGTPEELQQPHCKEGLPHGMDNHTTTTTTTIGIHTVKDPHIRNDEPTHETDEKGSTQILDNQLDLDIRQSNIDQESDLPSANRESEISQSYIEQVSDLPSTSRESEISHSYTQQESDIPLANRDLSSVQQPYHADISATSSEEEKNFRRIQLDGFNSPPWNHSPRDRIRQYRHSLDLLDSTSSGFLSDSGSRRNFANKRHTRFCGRGFNSAEEDFGNGFSGANDGCRDVFSSFDDGRAQGLSSASDGRRNGISGSKDSCAQGFSGAAAVCGQSVLNGDDGRWSGLQHGISRPKNSCAQVFSSATVVREQSLSSGADGRWQGFPRLEDGREKSFSSVDDNGDGGRWSGQRNGITRSRGSCASAYSSASAFRGQSLSSSGDGRWQGFKRPEDSRGQSLSSVDDILRKTPFSHFTPDKKHAELFTHQNLAWSSSDRQKLGGKTDRPTCKAPTNADNHRNPKRISVSTESERDDAFIHRKDRVANHGNGAVFERERRGRRRGDAFDSKSMADTKYHQIQAFLRDVEEKVSGRCHGKGYGRNTAHSEQEHVQLQGAQWENDRRDIRHTENQDSRGRTTHRPDSTLSSHSSRNRSAPSVKSVTSSSDRHHPSKPRHRSASRPKSSGPTPKQAQKSTTPKIRNHQIQNYSQNSAENSNHSCDSDKPAVPECTCHLFADFVETKESSHSRRLKGKSLQSPRRSDEFPPDSPVDFISSPVVLNEYHTPKRCDDQFSMYRGSLKHCDYPESSRRLHGHPTPQKRGKCSSPHKVSGISPHLHHSGLSQRLDDKGSTTTISRNHRIHQELSKRVRRHPAPQQHDGCSTRSELPDVPYHQSHSVPSVQLERDTIGRQNPSSNPIQTSLPDGSMERFQLEQERNTSRRRDRFSYTPSKTPVHSVHPVRRSEPFTPTRSGRNTTTRHRDTAARSGSNRTNHHRDTPVVPKSRVNKMLNMPQKINRFDAGETRIHRMNEAARRPKQYDNFDMQLLSESLLRPEQNDTAKEHSLSTDQSPFDFAPDSSKHEEKQSNHSRQRTKCTSLSDRNADEFQGHQEHKQRDNLQDRGNELHTVQETPETSALQLQNPDHQIHSDDEKVQSHQASIDEKAHSHQASIDEKVQNHQASIDEMAQSHQASIDEKDQCHLQFRQNDTAEKQQQQHPTDAAFQSHTMIQQQNPQQALVGPSPFHFSQDVQQSHPVSDQQAGVFCLFEDTSQRPQGFVTGGDTKELLQVSDNINSGFNMQQQTTGVGIGPEMNGPNQNTCFVNANNHQQAAYVQSYSTGMIPSSVETVTADQHTWQYPASQMQQLPTGNNGPIHAQPMLSSGLPPFFHPMSTPFFTPVNTPCFQTLSTPFLQQGTPQFSPANFFQFPPPQHLLSFDIQSQMQALPYMLQSPCGDSPAPTSQQLGMTDNGLHGQGYQPLTPLDTPCGFGGNIPVVTFSHASSTGVLPGNTAFYTPSGGPGEY